MKAKLENLRRLAFRQAVVAASMVSAGSAFAAAPDVEAVVTEITAAATPIAAIGSAVLLVMVGIKVFKWVRRAM